MQFIKRFLFILIGVIALLTPGCKKPKPTPTPTPTKKAGIFQLQIKAVYGSQSFALNSFNTDPAGRYISTENFQFFLSHMYLVGTDSLVKVTDVGFFDLGSPSTLTINDSNVVGNFTGIKFYCGVDSLQDTTVTYTDPNFPPGLLAGQNAMYWGMLRYQFENVSGKWDTAALQDLRDPFLYHIGGYNYLYKPVSFNLSFSVDSGSTITKTLTLDVEKIFYNGSNQVLSIDTQGVTMCDSVTATGGAPNALAIARQFTTNFANAFSFQ